ncbi:MAG: lysozyme family protein [Faecalibacillus sp.]
MAKDIKTKEVIKDIKTVDKKRNLQHFEKKQDISDKSKINEDESCSNQQVTPKNYAINKTIHTEKQTAVHTGIEAKRLIIRKKKAKEQKEKQLQSRIKEKSIQNNKIKTKNKTDILEKSKDVSNQPRKKIKRNQTVSSQTVKSNNYNQRMKLHLIAKHKNKVKEAKETSSKLSVGTNATLKVFKGTFGAVKKAATNVNNIITMGMGLIILIVITLFIGVFSALSDDSSVDTSSAYVSDEVLAYTETIEKYAKEYEIEDYVALIQAVMMQESGGKGKDPMQSSECSYNEKYPKKHNGITNSDYSIKVGVQYLAECLKNAKANDPSDISHISLALQGYNYGNGYISWAVEHFGGYTRANAKVFSDEKKAELQVKVYGDPEYVPHVLRYYHIGNGNIVMVAKSQVGNVGGKKYWEWYGFKSRVEWCCVFISYCASESGDLDKTIPKFSGVSDGMTWFKKHDKWKGSSYTPNAGDIIFFDWNQNGNPDHVGIVEKAENGRVYTIEGNSKDEVRLKNYSVNYKCIFGYGLIGN